MAGSNEPDICLVRNQNQGETEKAVPMMNRPRLLGEYGIPRTKGAQFKLEDGFLSRAAHGAIFAGLSIREKEVLRLLLAGQSNAQIAAGLFVSESTIKYHVHNLLQKTGCASRQQLITKYNLLLYPQAPS